ncbi:MAG: DNA-processing protein DprA [Comamonas sp.]
MTADLTHWERADLEAWLRLSLTPGVGNAAARRLLARFGSATAIFTESVAELQTCVSLAQAAQLRHPPENFSAACETTWQWLHSNNPEFGHALITLGDPRYPESLLHTADPPLMLYVMGSRHWLERHTPLVDWQHSLAIVGSRNPTPQGADNAYQFAHHLAGQGWCIVSGMALGIDAAAHEGAMAASSPSLPTIAVVGTGVDRVYPRQHKQLAHQLAHCGLVISEFPLGTPPIASNFPKRNRIISGLSRGTLVVEAALASGSLITARTASEQGREVFAIPGSIHSPQAHGCHALIQQGAKLVERAQDILEEWGDHMPKNTVKPPAASASTATEHPLLKAMGYDPAHLDTLVARTGWSAADLQAQLLELELEGWVHRLAGGLFQRTGQA